VTAPELSIVAVSDAFLRATRLARGEVIGRGIFELLSADDPSGSARARDLRRSLEKVIETRSPDVVPAPLYGIGGRAPAGGDATEREWVAINAPVFNDAGHLTLIVHALEEASDGQSLQERLARTVAARDEALRTSQLKTRLLGMISHELRTPLTSLSLQVERMQRNAADLTLRHHESLERIAFSAGRMREMIETLLEYARVEGGHVTVGATRFDLADSLRKTVAHHRHEAEQRGLQIHCRLHVAPAVVHSDPRLIELVVSNLVHNAIKFTASGRVEVALDRSPDGSHRISVTDTGPGIAEPQQKRIFEPFEQLGSERPPLAGIGLGLALVRDLAAALGGRIELVSRLGEGSVFTLVLPPGAGVGTREAGKD
jgi:signal transduction histidine kinase